MGVSPWSQKLSSHDTFLELPSSGTCIVKFNIGDRVFNFSTFSESTMIFIVFDMKHHCDLLPMQSVPITTNVVSSNLDQGEVYNKLCGKVCQ